VVYGISVTDDKERAIAAATAMTELEGLTDSEPLNRIAYDMAERGLAPDVAITLSEMALMHASSAYDSVMVLDTVGWAYYAAGEPAKAADYLLSAVDKMDETLTMDNEIVQHLLTAYQSAGMRDEEIDLLAAIASRSVDANDPARRRLRELLIERDGNADAMDTIIAGLRYEGVETAPAFSLPDRSGRMVSLDSMKGDILVVCFWSYG
jgi:lipopolysaccharide biosynthesis regulator YciM